MIPPGDHVVDYVDGYLHEALRPLEMQYVREHCDRCRICQLALEEARQRLAAVQSLPPVTVPDTLVQAAARRVERRRRWTRRVVATVWAAVAASVLIAGSVHLYYASLAPSPYDLRVLGQAEWLADSRASLRVVLWDTSRNTGVGDVPVDVELAAKDSRPVIRLASFRTNQYGTATPVFQLPDEVGQEYELRVRAAVGRAEESVTRPIKLRRSWQLMLSSDKPVYQPGQTIHLRALALARGDHKPMAGQEVVFAVSDPKGNVIFRQRNVTSRFGIASADCPLAAEVVEGAFQVRCELNDTVSKRTVEVKKYVLPKIKLDVELDRPFYAPGARVHGRIRAAYFFGKPVADANVRVVVQGASPAAAQLVSVEARTSADGTGTFEFTIPQSLVGSEQEAGDATIRIAVTIQDTAGQKQTKSLRRTVTTNPIRIEVIPESGRLVPGLPNTVYLFTSYPDGRPARTRISVSGIDRELATGDLGITSLEVSPSNERVSWTIVACDEQGLSGRKDVALDCGQAADDFLVRTDKAVYAGGETMHLVALGGGNEPVFLDLIKDGQTIMTDQMSLANGRGQCDWDLPPELCGTLELCTYRYGAAGLPVRKSHVLFVKPGGGLQVRTDLDRPEYRPGDKAVLRFTLTDAQGRPAPGALSLAAVDEAVFSVLSQSPGLQQTFLYLEEELLKPVYAIYDWSPDFAPSAPADERNRLEQALFSQAAKTRTDPNALLRQLIDKYGEGQRRMLEVLERPDWEELVKYIGWFPPEALALLRGERTIHSLNASSYPAKRQQVQSLQQRRLEIMPGVWFGIVVIGGIALLSCHLRRATCCVRGVTLGELLLVVLILFILASLLLPAVQCARESSRRTMAVNDLKNLALVIENARDAGQLPTEDGASSGASPVRVREWFPETLLWRPELITDDVGQAQLELDLADSITTWRLSAGAVTADGRLGGGEKSIRVFQPFFVDLDLPVALTRGDEVAVPAVVYNYLDRPQTVELTLADAPWFERLDEPVRKLELGPNEVRAAHYRLRASKVGRHQLQVDARGAGVADAVRRDVTVVPDGRRVERTQSGTLQEPVEFECSLPADAIEGSVQALVKIYPSSFTQLVEGLDAIFQRPYGCFEQTSSTTYPNVLALDYLRRTGKSVPTVEAKARQYIHLGYQRLLGFEVSGGGFDWFGRPPANRVLTAYGLMEFTDMARVHDVDPALIERTRKWLLDERAGDGSWSPESRALHSNPAESSQLQLTTTAYIAWAVFGGQPTSGRAQRTADYLLRVGPQEIADPYALALVANALLAIDRSGRSAAPYLERLEQLKTTSDDGKLVWWEPAGERRTMFYGAGLSRRVETTALAALALLQADRAPMTTRAALSWLVAQKDAHGTWHSTQATVLALKALVAGTGKPLGGSQARAIDIALDGKTVRRLDIPTDQSDVLQQIDLSGTLGSGRHRVTLREHTLTGTGYQIVLVYHAPGAEQPADSEPLAIRLDYDRIALPVEDVVTATATVVNRLESAAPMVILDLPVPAGFAVEAEAFDQLVAVGTIARYQLTPRSAAVYLRQLEPGKPLELRYRLRAKMPVKVSVPPAQVYEYYDPAKSARSDPAQLTVTARDAA
jgi:type II secretory pathway pseudopilin PulG